MLANIYLGKVTNWDASAIAKINKGVKLPNLKITPVFRSDGSCDTYAPMGIRYACQRRTHDRFAAVAPEAHGSE